MNAFTMCLEVPVTGRREQQKELRERRILKAAEALFAKRGYAGTGMQDIARRARLAVGTLYNYFPSKPEILLAIARRDTAAGIAAGEAILKRPPRDPVAAVRTLVESAVKPFTHHDRALWRELTSAALANPSLAQAVFESDLKLVGLLTTLLRDLQARGDLRPDADPGRAAVALYAGFFTWFMLYAVSEELSATRLRSEIGHGVELVMNGLLARAPTEGELP
jgi:AcrR family transcriptional regulator